MVGVDQMAFFASYLRHLLALLDLRAEVVASASQEALRPARIDEETLVIAFLQRGPHALVLRAAKLARKRGCCHGRGHGREHLELDQAVRPLPVLLVQQPVLHALARALLRLIQALPTRSTRTTKPRTGALN